MNFGKSNDIMNETDEKPDIMSSQFSGIKIEGNDIHSYLETFNKEIENGESSIIAIGEEQSEPDDSEGTYFIDQSGHYYYQANADSQPVMTVVQGIPQDTDEVVTSLPEDDQEQVLLENSDAFQAVTIVQSDTNPGEVSYVLIMQEPDDEEKDKDTDTNDMVDMESTEHDLAVYDFDENEEELDESLNLDSDIEDDKSKIMKILPKKSQTVAQAHMCNYCNYTSPKRYLLSRHMKSHSEERPHKCSVCERGFKTLASLQNHVNTHTGTKPHHCKFCESAFTTSGELVRHVRYRHTHEKPHKCHECDYASVELSKLKRHIRCHTGERPYQCPHCTYASPDTFKLKRHLRIHTGEKPYECDICTMRFTQSNSLKAHKLVHNVEDKPIFQCELCPTTCGRKTDLRIHVQKLHTSDKPLKCKRCGKSFPDRYSYKTHAKTHEGEKCFKCDLCVYASISARHLQSHMLIHTDEKPFLCEHCDQSFRQKQLLKRHQNLYHNPDYVPPPPQEKTHTCPECNRSFRHKGNLIRHMAIHDPESSVQEKALQLKMGRQKKLHIIDGQQIEVMPSMSYESDDSDGDMVAVEGSDGQQYVVLEVIELGDEDEENGLDPSLHAETLLAEAADMDGSFLLPENMDEVEILQSLHDSRKVGRAQIVNHDPSNDMDNCFGFDDEDVRQEEEEDEDDKKSTIKLLENFHHE